LVHKKLRGDVVRTRSSRRAHVARQRCQLRSPRVTCNMAAWRAPGIEYVSIGGGCAPRGFGPCKFGSRTSGLRSSLPKHIGSRLLSRRASTSRTIKRLSMRYLSTWTLPPSPRSEARRHLRRRGSRRLHSEAQTGGDRPGRSLRRDSVGHGLPANNRSRRGAADPDRGRTHRRDRDRTPKFDHGRQDHHDAAGQRSRSPWPNYGRRCDPPRPRTPRVPRAGRMTLAEPC